MGKNHKQILKISAANEIESPSIKEETRLNVRDTLINTLADLKKYKKSTRDMIIKNFFDDGMAEIENSEITGELKDFRKKWWRDLKSYEDIELYGNLKNEIIKKLNKIPLNIKIDSDGNKLIEFKLGNKAYKLLDVQNMKHSDDKYRGRPALPWMARDEIELGGMRGDDVDEWENQKLKGYVKGKEREGLHIPKIEEMKSLLKELGKEVGIMEEKDQIAMLMYLTGMYGHYWLSMGDGYVSDSKVRSRSVLICGEDCRCLQYFDDDLVGASLFMIGN